MVFSWTEPIKINNRGTRVAAVNPETHMVMGIYDNVVHAAKAFSENDVQERAKDIGKALENYHMEVCGCWWKRVR